MDKIQLLGLMVEAANELDRSGFLKEADDITGIMEKVAEQAQADPATAYLNSYPDLRQQIINMRFDSGKVNNMLMSGQHKMWTNRQQELINATKKWQQWQQQQQMAAKSMQVRLVFFKDRHNQHDKLKHLFLLLNLREEQVIAA